jgi:zinc transporter 1/2/3
LILKLIYMAAIFAIGMIGGRAPAKLAPHNRHASRLALGEAFSGGIFLGAGFLHLLPDSADMFSQFAGDIDFPLAPAVAGIGLLLILLFDQLAEGKTDRGQGHPFLLFLVLSIHSVIAGAALGLEGTSVASIAIFIAIMAHKGSAGFALGIALVKDGADKATTNRTILMFAAMTPLGVALGAFLASIFAGTTDIVFEAVFDGLAAGTFLYVATFDILPGAMKSPANNLVKWAAVVAGFSVMALIAIWA